MAPNWQQGQTAESFSQKWKKFDKAGYNAILNDSSKLTQWIIQRNGFLSYDEMKKWVHPYKRVLDAGCGNGRMTTFFALNSLKETKIFGADLPGVAEVALENLKDFSNVEIFEFDLLENLEKFGKFDFIYCQEVLHHTAQPEKAFHNLVSVLAPNGEIAIYVYKKKSPTREFTDDYIRKKIEDLSLEESSHAINQITEFARTLSGYNLEIILPDVDILEIKGGRYTFQRFLYNHFFKNFWNDEFSVQENFSVNFDWYHPSICFRYTMPEVLEWFTHENLTIFHTYEDEYGITIRAKSL